MNKHQNIEYFIGSLNEEGQHLGFSIDYKNPIESGKYFVEVIYDFFQNGDLKYSKGGTGILEQIFIYDYENGKPMKAGHFKINHIC